MGYEELSFVLYPVQRLIWTERIYNDRYLYKIFKKKKVVNKEVLEEIKMRLGDEERPNWLVVQVTGETGEFKSSFGLDFIKKLIDPTFCVERVCMTYSELEEKISKSKPKQAFLLDEQVFQSGTGSNRMKQNFINLVETLRKRQNSLVLITPKEKTITDDNVTFTLEPCGFDKKTKTLRLLVKKRFYIGLFYMKLSWKSKLWKEYELVKDDFMTIASTQQFRKFDYEKTAKKLFENIPEKYKVLKRKRVKLYLEMNSPNITTEERDLLLEELMILIEEEPFTKKTEEKVVVEKTPLQKNKEKIKNFRAKKRD